MRNKEPKLYWRLIDEQTGKWTYKQADVCEAEEIQGNYLKIIINLEG